MSKTTYTWLAVLVWAGVAVPSAAAQGFGPRVGAPTPGPTVSPYLNLLRGSSGPTLNYYGLVRPQVQGFAGLQALQQHVGVLQSGTLPGAGLPDDLLITGRAAVFMNYGGYFQSPTGGAAGRSAAALRVGGAGATNPATPRLPAPGRR